MERTGPPRATLEQGGVHVVLRDEPPSRGATRRRRCRSWSGPPRHREPRAPARRPGDPLSDSALLYQAANHAALGVRNLRSVEELTYLKTYLEDLIEHANALICVASRAGEVIVWNAALRPAHGRAARRRSARSSPPACRRRITARSAVLRARLRG